MRRVTDGGHSAMGHQVFLCLSRCCPSGCPALLQPQSGRRGPSSVLFLILFSFWPYFVSAGVSGRKASSEGLVTVEAIPSTVQEGVPGFRLHCLYTPHPNETSLRILWSRLRDGDNNPEVIFEKSLSKGRGHSGANYTFSGSWKGRKAKHDVTSLADVSLEGDDVTRDDAGTYRCEVSSDVKLVYGDAAVTVLYGPRSSVRITSQQGSFRIEEGETITLICTASCVPSCQFRWTCSGCMATRAAMLTIPSIQRDQSGTYTCLAYNEVTRGRADVIVDVLYPSSIRQLQFAEGGNTAEVEEGQRVSISCQATGNPPPDIITWSASGQSKDNETFEMGYGHDKSSVYMLSSASCHDNDKYTCTAANRLGADVGSVHLKVLCSPIKSTDSSHQGNGTQNYVIPFTSSANVTACVTARPMPTVRWYRVIRDVTTPRFDYDVMFDDITARMVTSINVSTAEAEDYGLYRVTIENERGAYEETFSVVAREPPQPPYNLTVTNVTMTSFSLTWLPGFDGGAPQTFLMTYYTDIDDDEVRIVLDQDPHDVIVDNMKEDAVYYVILVAENEFGKSREVTVNVTTLSEMKSEQITSMSALMWVKVGVPLGGAVLLFLVVSLLLCRRRHRSFRRQIAKSTATKNITPLCIINENVRLSYLESGQGGYVDAASTTTTAHDVTNDVTRSNDVGGDVTTGMERSGSWLFGGIVGRTLGVEDLSRRSSSTSSANIYLDVLGDPLTYIIQDTPEDNRGSSYMNIQTDADVYEDTSATADHNATTLTASQGQLPAGLVEGYVNMRRQARSDDVIDNSDDANNSDEVSVDYDDVWCVTSSLPVPAAAEPELASSSSSSSPEGFSTNAAASRCPRDGGVTRRSPQYGVIPTITVTQDEGGATTRHSAAYHVLDVSNASGDEEHIYDVIRDSDVED